MLSKPKNRRKKLVVNRQLQGRIVFGVTLVPILALFGATLAVALLTGQVLEEARSAEESLPTLGPLFISLFLFIVAAGAVVVIQALKYSHKIAGPMYRIVKSMKRIQQRDLSFRVRLRPGDELQDIADELSRLMDWLQAHPLRDEEWNLVPPDSHEKGGGGGDGAAPADKESVAENRAEQMAGAGSSTTT